MRILLYDSALYYPSSPLFLEALEELSKEMGYEFAFFDEAKFLKPLQRSLIHKVAYHLLKHRPLTYWSLNRSLLKIAYSFRPNLVLVVGGKYISPAVLKRIKEETAAVLVNYITDNPFHPAVSTSDLREAIPLYDLCACTSRAFIGEVEKAGSGNVENYVPFGYKPSIHFPESPKTPTERERFTSEVAFIGTCDYERFRFFEALIIRLSNIHFAFYGGGYYNRSPLLIKYYRGNAIGRDYRLALNGAKIVIVPGRRPHHRGPLMRVFEVPACGAFMLAERTEEHLELFKEGEEIACFGSVEEAVEKINYYLVHEEERRRIAQAGYRKIINGQHTYKDRLLQILEKAKSLKRI